MEIVEHNEICCFQGTHAVSVDSSHRIMLPYKWRVESGLIDFVIIMWPVLKEEYLLVLPPKRWQRAVESFSQCSLSDEKAATVERVLSSTSQAVRLDRYGRLPIPEWMATKIGFKDKATILGRLSKFEIWPPELWEARVKETKMSAYDFITSMNL